MEFKKICCKGGTCLTVDVWAFLNVGSRAWTRHLSQDNVLEVKWMRSSLTGLSLQVLLSVTAWICTLQLNFPGCQYCCCSALCSHPGDIVRISIIGPQGTAPKCQIRSVWWFWLRYPDSSPVSKSLLKDARQLESVKGVFKILSVLKGTVQFHW